MSRARERARKVAAEARPVEPGFYNIPSKPLISTDDSTRIADATSDVWEPVVRDLLSAIEHHVPMRLPDEFWTEVQRVREVLES